VVEDDTDDSFLLTRQITAAQIEEIVTVVRTAEEALEFLQKQEAPPLVVFLDLRLPDIPVIVMTGHVDPKDVATCNELGVTAFLEKPVGLSTFIKSVAHLFPKHRGGEAE
jgi:CheY-like chemotaxis protein